MEPVAAELGLGVAALSQSELVCGMVGWWVNWCPVCGDHCWNAVGVVGGMIGAKGEGAAIGGCPPCCGGPFAV